MSKKEKEDCKGNTGVQVSQICLNPPKCLHSKSQGPTSPQSMPDIYLEGILAPQ